MSSILRALKKLEKDSHHPGDPPQLESKFVPLADTGPHRSAFRLFSMVAGAGVICGIVFLAGWYFFSGRHATPPPESAATPVQQPQAVTAPPVQSLVTSEAPDNAAAGEPQKPPFEETVKTIAAGEAKPDAAPAAETAEKIQPSDALPNVEAVVASENPAIPEKEPDVPPGRAGLEEAASAEPPPEEKVSAVEIRKLNDPDMRLQAITWSREPQKRIAVISNRIVREGDSISGYLISTINQDDVVLSRAGEKWHLPFRIK